MAASTYRQPILLSYCDLLGEFVLSLPGSGTIDLGQSVNDAGNGDYNPESD